ncbi:MAG: hypothetical protein DHS20C15_10850 [Planctomycetota bacterium]|nr:MAG: hypothetical protein DHS20C15_10850 [Planctomycetota bacterium]
MNILIALVLALPLQVDADSELSDEALVERIRETLNRVDDALLETSEARDAREGLAAVREHHLQVIRDLEKLISNQKYRKGGSGGSGGSPEGDPSPSPSQGESAPRESDGSSSPKPGEGEASQPESGEESGASGSEQEQEQPSSPEGSTPQSGAGDDSAGRNEPGGPPPPDSIEPVTREDVDERWGLLPPKLQERLMNLHVDDVPARYRTWMEAYVRAMHALEDRSSGR